MSFTDRHIIETYSSMFEGLNSQSKLELIERLSRSLQLETKKKENKFFRSFGAFADERTPEEIVKEIRSARNFRKRDIKL